MKKTVIFLVVILLSVSAFSQIRPLRVQNGQSSRVYTQGNQYQYQTQTQAQTYQQSQQVVSKNNTFVSLDEARRAYASNNFTYYQPSDLRAYGNNPVDGVTKIKLALEQDAIVKMVVKGGILYVIIPRYSECRFYKYQNGSVDFKPYAFDLCGNAIYEFEYAVQCNPCNGQANQVNLNNYSERPIQQPYQQQYVQPNLGNCNDCNQTIKRKGWTTTQKLLAIVGTAVVSYAIYSISTKKNNNTATNTGNGNNNGDQTVITGGASSVPKSHSVGLSLGVRF